MTEMAQKPAGFSSISRTLEQEDEIRLTSVGVDIGSSTSHLVFSQLVMEQISNRYVVTQRHIFHESDVILTPYTSDMTIDAAVLGRFIEAQYKAAEVTPDDIDTGALILTGVAVRRTNARAIGDLFASQAGKFVSVSAGDSLEATLVAYGSGAVVRSIASGQPAMNVDIGGGTSKISLCCNGEVTGVTAIDVGARILCFDDRFRITYLEEAGKQFLKDIGLDLVVGDRMRESDIQQLVDTMADRLFQAMGGAGIEQETSALMRLDALADSRRPGTLSFSGGVSEYIYQKTEKTYGDLGALLAAAILDRVKNWEAKLARPSEGLRATVVGASQYTIQVSSSTVYVEPHGTLPIRNIPVVTPQLPLDDEILDQKEIARYIKETLQRKELLNSGQPVALCFRWQGSASYQRLDAFCRSAVTGMTPLLERGLPLILVNDGDIGGLIGLHCAETLKLDNPIVSIDGIWLKEFDYIDIGALMQTSGAVPVVIKSLVFPVNESLGQSH